MKLKSGSKNILVSRLRFMGDVILTTPLLHTLKTNIPETRITYLAEFPYSSLLENHPAVDEVLTLYKDDLYRQLHLAMRLMHDRYEISIDLFGNPRSAILTFMTGAKMRIGGDFRGRRRLYTHVIRDDKRPKPATLFHLNYLAPLGIRGEPVDPYIVLTESEKKRAAQHLVDRGYDPEKQIIAIHAGASWPAKRWLPERFTSLADRIVSEHGIQLFWVVSPGSEDLIEGIRQACTFQSVRGEVLPLRRLAAVLSRCEMLITNDSGPMHLAPAVNTKTIGIFGPGEPEIWFPYNMKRGHRFVHKEIECSRCRRDLCNAMDCMRSITVEEVFEIVSELLRFEPS